MYRIVSTIFVICFLKCIFADVCVLYPMITHQHKQCIPPKYCPKSHDIENDTSTTSNVTWLTPDDLDHFQSVRAVSDDELNRALAESNIIVSDETLNKTSINENDDCDPNYKYRSFSGSCNNLEHHKWGKSDTPYLRMLMPRYSTTTGKIAVSVTGARLPLPRYISATLFPDVDRPSENNTLAAMQWGQLVAHDTSLSPSARINCCLSEVYNSNNQCYPIEIPDNDTFYSQFNQTCMNMVRTDFTYSKFGCEEIREQAPNVTHYMDLSNLYGSSSLASATLRQFSQGLLQASYTQNGREFPPKSIDPFEDCNDPSDDQVCFRGGDFRVNQNTQFTCLQTVLLREHNRIARILGNLNSHWDDETIFQTTRAICIAQFQHISFNEWLPVYVSDEMLTEYDLKPLSSGYTNYSAKINAGSLNSFATGAFRGLHSDIQGLLLMFNSNRCPVRQLNISDYMNKPGIIVVGTNLDELLRGLTIEPKQKFDRYFTSQMTEMMFHRNMWYGEDLVSYDIQRGRDHGIQTYNNMRELCGYSRAETFEDLIPDMGSEKVSLLSEVYESVDDIDFYVGGMYENKLSGVKFGPVFSCIITEQFIRKKYGDRFWYEVGGQSHSLTEDQLEEIRKCSFSRLLCDNADNITSLQPNGFFKNSERNEIVPCDLLPQVNLSMWIEN